jgi:Domain of unknown function (DUF4190)
VHVRALAVASFVLGILPGSLIAVGLGIGALLQIGREGGKGRWMAIVGVVLGALWTVFLTIGIVADAQDNEPTPPHAVKQDVATLKVGDCAARIPDGRVGDVPAIDCAQPHREEMYAVLTLPGSKYRGEDRGREPGQRHVQRQARLDAHGRRRAPGRDRHLLPVPEQVLVGDRRTQRHLPDPAPEGLLRAPSRMTKSPELFVSRAAGDQDKVTAVTGEALRMALDHRPGVSPVFLDFLVWCN